MTRTVNCSPLSVRAEQSWRRVGSSCLCCRWRSDRPSAIQRLEPAFRSRQKRPLLLYWAPAAPPYCGRCDPGRRLTVSVAALLVVLPAMSLTTTENRSSASEAVVMGVV